jgi:IS30 family transposase
MTEREEISRGLCAGQSIRSIAGGFGRAASTISREVRRHSGRYGYRANHADYEAWAWALRPKPCLLAGNAKLRELVAGKLAQRWSPQQICGWLKREHPDDESMHVSHETIYKSLFIQARGVLKKELMGYLRSRRRLRRPQKSSSRKELRGKLADMVSIRERPAEAEDRAIPGHWEGDLLCGSKRSQIVTLVERRSRFTTLIKVPDNRTATVVAALSRHVRRLPPEAAAAYGPAVCGNDMAYRHRRCGAGSVMGSSRAETCSSVAAQWDGSQRRLSSQSGEVPASRATNGNAGRALRLFARAQKHPNLSAARTG